MLKFQEENSGARKAENEALYAQYIGFSKLASKLFLLLVSLALYIGFTLYENKDVIDKNKDSIFREMQGSVYGPVSSELYEAAVKKSLEEIQYEMPIVGKDIKGTTFFIVSPIIFFVITLIYWFHLQSVQQSISRYFARVGTRKRELLNPSLYNLQFFSPITRTVWQGIMELSPVIFLSFLLHQFAQNIEHFETPAVLSLWLTVAPVFLHRLIFYQAFQRSNFLNVLAFGYIAWLSSIYLGYDVSDLIRSLLVTNLSELIGFFMALLVSVELVLTGRVFIAWLLVSPLGIFIFWPVPWMLNRYKEVYVDNYYQFCKMQFLKMWNKPTSGYVGYFRDKYREQKRLQ